MHFYDEALGQPLSPDVPQPEARPRGPWLSRTSLGASAWLSRSSPNGSASPRRAGPVRGPRLAPAQSPSNRTLVIRERQREGVEMATEGRPYFEHLWPIGPFVQSAERAGVQSSMLLDSPLVAMQSKLKCARF